MGNRMMNSSNDFNILLNAVNSIAKGVAAEHADDVDSKARFPIETVTALKETKVLSAAVPKEFGGPGCTMLQLAQLCSSLSAACGSSGMVLAMHYGQLASIARHHGDNEFFKSYLKDMVTQQYLLASITSEVGTSGDTRSSICALERNNGRFTLNKQATTGSYCANADAILATCRRNSEAPNSDQLLVMVLPGDYTLTQTTTWDTMGMRGTCSPGFSLESSAPEIQVLPDDFADIAAQTMVPYSHILWSSIWWGIANDAVHKAASYVRGQARKTPGVMPTTATRLAEVTVMLQSMKHNWLAVATEFDEIASKPDANSLLQDIRWSLKLNSLKIAASDLAPQIVHKALQIVGLLGYKNDSPYSLSRHYRDALSASIMISNDRVASKSATLLLVSKD
jgi:acyl-CoA dehydrogenase